MDELDTREWVDQVVAGLPYARALSGGLGFAAAIPRARTSRLGYWGLLPRFTISKSIYISISISVSVSISISISISIYVYTV